MGCPDASSVEQGYAEAKQTCCVVGAAKHGQWKTTGGACFLRLAEKVTCALPHLRKPLLDCLPGLMRRGQEAVQQRPSNMLQLRSGRWVGCTARMSHVNDHGRLQEPLGSVYILADTRQPIRQP